MNKLLEQAKKLKLKLAFKKTNKYIYGIVAFRISDLKASILINNDGYIYYLEQPQTKKIDELLQKLIQKVKNIDENTINQLFLEHNKQIDETQAKIFDIHNSNLNYYKYKKQGKSNTEYTPELTANVIYIYEGGK